MSKSTISMVIFHSDVTNYQRVNLHKMHPLCLVTMFFPRWNTGRFHLEPLGPRITKEEKVLHTVGRLEVEFWLLEFSHFVHRLWLGEILLKYEVEYDTRFDNPGDFAIFICWVDLFLWLITDSLSTQTTSPNGANKIARACSKVSWFILVFLVSSPQEYHNYL